MHLQNGCIKCMHNFIYVYTLLNNFVTVFETNLQLMHKLDLPNSVLLLTVAYMKGTDTIHCIILKPKLFKDVNVF